MKKIIAPPRFPHHLHDRLALESAFAGAFGRLGDLGSRWGPFVEAYDGTSDTSSHKGQ